MVKYLIFLLVFSTQLNSFGQAKVPTPIDTKQINAEAKNLINEFRNFLPKLAMSKDNEQKKVYKTSIESLFEKNATIEVASFKRKKPYSLTEYLNTVANYTKRFELVVFTFKINSINTKNLEPIRDTNGEIIKYRGTYTFTQGFCVKIKKAENPEGFDYKDPDSYDVCEETTKEGEFFLEKEYQRVAGSHWVVKLGNITAKHIEDKKNKNN